MRPLLRNVAALAVLTLVAGVLLAWFAEVTEDEVAGNRLEAETRVLRELIGVETGAGDHKGRPYGALGDADVVLCERDLVVLRVEGSGYGGGFRLGVALDLDGSIKGVRVLEHAETPGFGDILNMPSAWLDSFTTGDVHAVTGATITSEAVTAAVERAVQRVRFEEICPEWNEPAGDTLVPSRLRGNDNVRHGRGQAPPRRALAGAIENAAAFSYDGIDVAVFDGRPQGPSGRSRALAGAIGSPPRVVFARESAHSWREP